MILHIIPDFLNTSLYNLFIQFLKKNGIENIVYVPSKYSGNNYLYKVDFLDRQFNLLDRFFYFRKQYCIYKNLINKNYVSDVKMIHAHNLFSVGLATMLLAKKKNIPYVVAVRNTDVNVFFKYMIHLRWLGVCILKNASKIVFLSPAYEKVVLERYVPVKLKETIKKKTIIIPNGINKFFLKNLYARTKYKLNKDIKLLYVGEIVKNKNIETTISACLNLQTIGYQVSFSVVGRVLDYKIKETIEQYPFIHYYLQCDQQEVLKHMRTSDIFIMPSITETFGLVYVEAMTQGMPIIYTKGQGFDGYFPQGTIGYAVDCFNQEDIVQKILKIYEDYDNISKRCIEKAHRFDWSKIALIYKNLYLSIINKS
ncbi:MAG: glycosyltransferase family 4 protein [Anaerovoracaceae bacterium]